MTTAGVGMAVYCSSGSGGVGNREPLVQAIADPVGTDQVALGAENTDPEREIVAISPRPAGGVKDEVTVLRVLGNKKILPRHQTEAGVNKFTDHGSGAVNGCEIPFLFKLKRDRKQNQFEIFFGEYHQRVPELVVPRPLAAFGDIETNAVANGLEFLQFNICHWLSDLSREVVKRFQNNRLIPLTCQTAGSNAARCRSRLRLLLDSGRDRFRRQASR
ncbi:MAG: hypothetical protein QNJ48_05470 [Desulfobacterales bacterium]|nr:hypothetical protein [Desulfobacterales bacterium]MDJ0883586.1 hypothetical protein [Desulfobacterales bacterium]